jgi:hypothetical protein
MPLQLKIQAGLCHGSGGRSLTSDSGGPDSDRRSFRAGFVVDTVPLGLAFSE